MKKVFACLSTILLMLVAFGLVMQPAKLSAAEVEEGKFIEDPTLKEGDIPIYSMNSIRTSFPDLYDANALPDPNYGIGRNYYWNEIKLVIPQIENNEFTGNQYTVYTHGTTASKIYLWITIPEGNDGAGTVTTATQTKSSVAWTGTYPPLFGDVSLSGVRYNVSGQTVHFNDVYRENGVGNGTNDTDFIYVIFDGEGHMVRGAAHDNYFNAENIATYGFTQLFGYKDGEIVLREDVIGAGKAVNGFGAADADLDRVQFEVDDLDNPLLDEVTGEPLYDDEGNPLYNKKLVDGEEPKFLAGQRYIWQWFSEEDFDAESVNTAAYLQEGWRQDLWDYAFADVNGGYVCLAFAPNLAKFAALTDAQATVHNASINALVEAGELTQEEADGLLIPFTSSIDETTQEETITFEETRRALIISFDVPVDGISYRYGYLDYAGAGVTEMHFDKFCRIFESGLLFGRKEGYRAHARTCNFTAAGLQAGSAQVDGATFVLREENGKLVYEIKAGTEIKPAKLVSLAGMLGCFLEEGDGDEESGSNVHAVQSYKNADASELEITMDINKEAVMRPIVHQYETLEQVKADFLSALLSWKTGKGQTFGEDTDWSTFANNTYGKFADGDLQLFAEEVPAWKWFVDYYTEKFEAQAAADEFTGYTVAAANGLRWGLYAFMNQIKVGSWPYSPDFSKTDYSDLVEHSPEKVFLYPDWDSFVTDFLDAFNQYVYGKVQVESPEDWWDMTYTADTELQAKQCAFFQEPEWKFVDQLIDDLCAAQEWTSYGKDHYYRYRCSMYAILNKTYRDVWPKSINCIDMPDPNWIGVPLEKDYSKVKFSTEGMSAPYSFTMDLQVLNKLTGVLGNIQVTFEVVNVFTPVIRVDEAELVVGLDQTSIDLSKAVKAYDGEYLEGSLYGHDISRQYLEFVLPEGFNPDQLKGGLYTITAIARAPQETGIKAETKFQIRVVDIVAPEIGVNKEVQVALGEQIDINKVLVYALDDVDGDLLRSAKVNWVWYVIQSDYDPLTASIGEEFPSKVVVMDNNGNIAEARFTVVVGGSEGVDNSEALEALQASLDAQAAKLDALQAKLNEVEQKAQQAADNAAKTVDNTTKGCKKSGMLVAGLVAAAGLVLVVLKKKH